ncbi:hypothetical protein Tco_1028461 [Tanacetum coccineum]|uniref:Uncharacterized protein n=1 Tax=Tanacetum coccineum TaxID=301880 RepID=A0ABQ5G103_9ASTR
MTCTTSGIRFLLQENIKVLSRTTLQIPSQDECWIRGAKDCQGGNWWDKVGKGVGRHRGEERGMMFCLEVRTLSREMMNSVPAVI